MLGGRQPNLVAKYLDGDPLAKAKVETIQERILATEHPIKAARFAQANSGEVMSVYKRGEAWWFKFRIHGQLIRESAKTSSKTLARDAERVRRRELEEAVNRIPKREKMPLFSIAAREWLDNRIGITPGSIDRYRQQVALLSKEFGNRLVCDIDHHDVTELQRKRQTEGRAGRTVNYEITTLRMILKSRGLWAPIGERVRALRERHDVGRALSREDERKLLDAIGKERFARVAAAIRSHHGYGLARVRGPITSAPRP